MEHFDLSIRCYYNGSTTHTQHRQTLMLKEIPKWIEAYRFTHPNCEAITIKIWLHEAPKADD